MTVAAAICTFAGGMPPALLTLPQTDFKEYHKEINAIVIGILMFTL